MEVYVSFAIICKVQRNALCAHHVHPSVCDPSSATKPLVGISQNLVQVNLMFVDPCIKYNSH